MPISFDSENRIFKLDTKTSSYVIEIYEENYLLNLYYGAKIPDYNLYYFHNRPGFASFSASNAKIVNPFGNTADTLPMEYSCNGTGDYRISALSITGETGSPATDIRYTAHRIYNGKPRLEGLPSLYINDDSEACTLEIDAEDTLTGALVTLIYTAFENHGAITRSAIIKNNSSTEFVIDRAYSACIDLPSMNYTMQHLYGRWSKERTLVKRQLEHGIQSVQSKRGSSSHQHNPFVALAANGTTEDFGGVYGFNLVYSGNFACDIEVDANDCTRLIMGINPTDFEWRLAPGESFFTPELVMVYSDEGIGGMSREFHRLYMKHLIRGEWRDKKRPLLINNWEATGMSFTDETLYSFAERAKEFGIELLVMDDGWFGKRDDDRSSLGDWFVDTKKFNGGLSHLIERVNALGIKFGIWYEPEMISPDSELYRAHPDWCLQVTGREKSIGRWQYVLDMTRKDVRDNIFAQIESVVANNNIEYIKWDFNRNLTEAGSLLLDASHQKETFHRFVLGTYELMGRLVDRFPNILLENCSGGGGRFDPGMLYYSPQIWCSDNTDPIERLTIQFGTSMCYPASTMGAHVSASKRAGFETKGNVALWGSFGYELDPNKITDEEKAIVKRQVAEYHKYYNLIHYGDLYRIIAPTDDAYRAAWEFVSEDKSEALLTAVVMRKSPVPTFFIKLKGLAPDEYYEDDNGEVYSGSLLMNAGLNCTRYPNNDGSSFKLYFKKTSNK